VRIRTVSYVSICIVFLTVALVWSSRQYAYTGARQTPSGHGPTGEFVPDKSVAPAATTFVVNNAGDQDDSNIGDGHCDIDGNLGNGDQCTLRAAVSEGKVGNTGHSVNFNLPSGSVIVLNTQLPSFSGNVTIVGPGSNQLTIQRSTAGGTPSFSIFFFAPINGNFTDAVSGLTIANGSSGCLVNQSFDTVTLTGMVVKNCTGTNGGGILNGGIMTITNSTITGNVASGNGGGIYNSGSSNNSGLNLTDTTVSGNSATGSGGGIHNEGGPANFSRITVNNNTANTQGGGIANSNSGANLTVTNSTVSGNTANAVNGNGGGIANIGVGSTLTLTNVTVTANASSATGGGGVSNVANTVTIGNSIVAKNTGGFADLKGTFVSGGYNLIGLSGGDGLNNGVNGDQVGSPGAAIDPLLGALADNGGATKTHALLVGSPAIDAGNSSQITDQRNLTRPVDDPTVANAAGGNASDIGSYEFNPYQVNTLVDADDGACTSLATGNGCTCAKQ
jgi:predicted outer membrane repeat protein